MLEAVGLLLGRFLEQAVFLIGVFLEALGLYFLFVFFFSPFNLFIAHITSRIAGRFLADPDYWFWRFLILPGIGQAIFLVEYVIRQISYRSRLRQQDLFGLMLWARYLEDLIRRRNSSDEPVTPFRDSVLSRVLNVTKWPTEVLNYWRDPDIDELIEWRQWRPAFEQAKEQLKKARRAGDRGSAEVYRAYLMILLPYVDHTIHLRNRSGPVTCPVAPK